LTAVHTDSRPDSANSAQGARTSPGPATIVLPSNGVKIDIQRFNLTALPKTFGLPAHAPKPAPPVVQSTEKVEAPATSTNLSPAEAAFLHEQQTAAKKDAADQKNKQRVASLMGQALATSDPQQQMDAYGQVVQIDPSNAAAVQGYKDAQQKLQAQQDVQTKAATTAVVQQQDANTRQQQTETALSKAQSAFLNGHLGEASSALSVAERLSPDNPLVRDLRSRIGAAQSLRSRLYFLGGGVGFLALMGLVAAWLRRRKMQRYPVLEITRGLDQGQVYPIEKDVVRIGAVAQDGGQRNEIIIRDIEHSVSRFHCEIVKRNGQIYVSDLNSSNGTSVNGASIKPGNPELLRKGSRILLANQVELRFGYDRTAKAKKNKSA
jgi:ribosomal protein L36